MALWGYIIIFFKKAAQIYSPPSTWCSVWSAGPVCDYPVRVIGRSNSLPASQPRWPVAASATLPPSRLLKGDTIPINVFLSTSLRCLFNTAPRAFGARTDWVKLHFSRLRERDVTPALQQVQGWREGPSGSVSSRGGTGVAVGTSLLGSKINQSEHSLNFICDYSVNVEGWAGTEVFQEQDSKRRERNWCWMVPSHFQGSRLNLVWARPGTFVVLHFEPCSETLAMFGQN